MAKIYKISDRIRVDIGGLVFKLGPLTYEQKAEIQALAASGDFKQALDSAKLAVKYGLKDVEGLEDSEGKPYQIKTDESGIADDCLNDLLNLEQNEQLSMVCLGLIRGIPDHFTNPFDGKKLEGVSIIKEGAGKKK